MILRIAMTGRKDDFRFSSMNIFSPQSEYQLQFRPDRINLPKNRTQPISHQKQTTSFHSSLLHMDFMLDRIKSSLTPKRTLQRSKFYSPKISLVSEYFTGNKLSKKITAENDLTINTFESSQLLACFERKSEEIAPLVFLRGEIEVQQILDPYNIRGKNDKKIIQILIPKLVNFSKEDFDPNTLCFYLLGTDKPVGQSEICLEPGDYSIILKASIHRKIRKQSTEKCLYLQTRFDEEQQGLFRINFVIILKNEKNKQILYWRNYLNPEQLVNQLRKKNQHSKKVEHIY